MSLGQSPDPNFAAPPQSCFAENIELRKRVKELETSNSNGARAMHILEQQNAELREHVVALEQVLQHYMPRRT